MGSQGEKKEKIIYDISELLEEDIVNIELENGELFLSCLDDLCYCCTKGGTRQNKKPVTHVDLRHPVCVARVGGMYKDFDVTTHFLILKSDLYNSGYCHEDDFRLVQNWTMLSGSLVILPGSQKATFGVSYIEKLSSTDEKRKSSKDPTFKRLKNYVGKEILLSALYALKYSEDEAEKSAAFHSVCYHLNEASRFDEVALRVYSGFSSPRNISDLKKKFNEWDFMCTCHRKGVVENDYTSWNSDLRFRIGIDNFEALDKDIRVVLMESEKKRDERRMDKLLSKDNRRALKKYKAKVAIGTIKQSEKSVPNRNRWTREQLEEKREEELRELIRLGGKSDIWICLKEACCQRQLRLKRLKIHHTDVNVVKSDLSEAYDDNAYQYEIGKNHTYMLCDPVGIPPA